MTYPVESIANYFIEKFKEKKDNDFTKLKLMKIIYIAYGYYSAINENNNECELFIDDIESWQYGPVIPSLYKQVKHIKGVINSPLINSVEVEKNGKTEKVLDLVYQTYAEKDAFNLVEKTHAINTPWHTAWSKEKYSTINKVEINKYYKKLLGLTND